ncbi:MAG TPA: GspE/PulE family protein, partial [Spongiibacteraceae bacterium]|nr:GspE/PulE family protein [Spongiibacteraceae bacterium]
MSSRTTSVTRLPPRSPQLPITSSAELLSHNQLHYSFTSRPLGEILVNMGLISSNQLCEALAEQQDSHELLGQLLETNGSLSHEQLLAGLSERFGIPYVNLQKFDIHPDAIRVIPAQFARKQRVMPIWIESGRLIVAISDPTRNELIQMLHFISGKVVEICIASESDIDYAISNFYGNQELESALNGVTLITEEPFHIDVNADSEEQANAAPVVQLLQNVIADAVARKASDIHIRPLEHSADLYFRVDGELQKLRTFNKHLLPALVSRIKIIGNMDIAEHRLPQDGRSRIHHEGKAIDLRLSVIPTIHGESVVIRLLDTQFALKNLEALGFEDTDAKKLRHLLTRNNGIFLVTGPTGSGKSTTLYTALAHVKQSNVNIITVEDPVEYHVDGIAQIQVNHATGYSFARALRHILRHDPDVIMVGEIRDPETAKMATESALTGHLVLSTLHTNDAATAVTRLVEIGIEPYLVNSALLGVLAQRLVRCNCQHCRVVEAIDDDVRKLLGVTADEVFYRGQGCEKCHGTGVTGRMAVYELLEV